MEILLFFSFLLIPCTMYIAKKTFKHTSEIYLCQKPITGFIRGILRGVRYAKSLRVLFLHRRSPSWTTLVCTQEQYSSLMNPPYASLRLPANTYVCNKTANCLSFGGGGGGMCEENVKLFGGKKS
jgi:hypothetical protein